ncbi:MAG: hypothetical protein GEU99_19735 [Luteitalea sp.]|nr:hypothetical protein [Luteitalea sp.]
MQTRRRVCTLVVLLPLMATHTVAQESRALSLQEVLARARERAPTAVAARARIAEAEARLIGASRRFRSNPVIEAALGPRANEAARSSDVEIGVSQAFEPGSRRTARVAAARAGIEQSASAADEALRLVLRDAALAFYDALSGQERLRLLGDATRVADEVLRTAERRYEAGDIAILEVNVARAAAARARAAEAAARAALTRPLADLRVLLGMSSRDTLGVKGSLSELDRRLAEPFTPRLVDLPALRTLDGQIREAEADQALARAQAKPDVGVSARYAKEETSHILLGGITITLPTFDRGQDLSATAAARLTRLRLERDALRREAEVRLQAGFERYTEERRGLESLVRDALPGLEENETLARRSYEVGELSLPEWLVLRRELLETRLEYVDRLFSVAASALDVDFASGALR